MVWNSLEVNASSVISLWIGFKILYLCDLKQCGKHFHSQLLVVNWFQNFVSLWSETVLSEVWYPFSLLWIGFKILYLCDLKQLFPILSFVLNCCELVSKFCIFVIWNSNWCPSTLPFHVVNWFQNFVSLWSETVSKFNFTTHISCELVSKFCIFVIWNSWVTHWTQRKRCELVSKFCIFVVWNSGKRKNQSAKCVVNWFQNFVSLWSETVWQTYSVWGVGLWIGFKILYLCGLKQYFDRRADRSGVVNWFQNFVSLWSETVISVVSETKSSCELVSKFCIFVIWNSRAAAKDIGAQVVNWFQNFVSLWSETVSRPF